MKKKNVLIISDDNNEIALSLQDALAADLSEYEVSWMPYGDALSQLHKTILNTYSEIRMEFNKRIEALQATQSDTLNKNMVNDMERLWTTATTQIDAFEKREKEIWDIFNKAFSSKTEIQPDIEKALADELEQLAKKKAAMLTVLEDTQTDWDDKKRRTIDTLASEWVNHEERLLKILSEIPTGAHTVLLDTFCRQMEAERANGFWKISARFPELHSGGETPLSLNIISKALAAQLSNVCCSVVVEAGDKTTNNQGIRFLRKYWAEIIRNDNVPPPAIFVSMDSLQDLIRKDSRYFVLNADGVDIVKFPVVDPAALGNKVLEKAGVSLSVAITRKFLKGSCDLAADVLIEHAWRNFGSPYSLLKGANLIDDIDESEYRSLLKRLHGKNVSAWEEVSIYDALSGSLQTATSLSMPEQEAPLAWIVGGKRILVIDDEAASAGLKDVLDILFARADSLEVIYDGEEREKKKWETRADLDADDRILSLLSSVENIEKFDLVLLDLYLTIEDEGLKKQQPHSKPTKDFGGIYLLKKIRELGSSVPVIFFTATTKAFNIQDAEKAGIDGYFQKRACYHSNEESMAYYLEFKQLLSRSLSEERILLRDISKRIETYKSSPDKVADVVQYLDSVAVSLKSIINLTGGSKSG